MSLAWILTVQRAVEGAVGEKKICWTGQLGSGGVMGIRACKKILRLPPPTTTPPLRACQAVRRNWSTKGRPLHVGKP